MRYSALTLLVLTIFLAGCAGGEGGPQNDITDPFVGGNVGLNLYFINGAPPPQVLDGGQMGFAVNIVAENVGETDIGPSTDNPYVTARIDGINPSTFGVTQADLEQNLQEQIRGARKNFDGTIIGGLVGNFLFDELSYQGKLVGNDLITLRGTVCYDYENTATTQICFKNDIVENVQDSTICTLTGEKLVHNSGGPVHITSVIQNPLGENRVQVNFVVEHVGPGEFYGRAPDEDCNPSVRNTNKFKVDLDVNMQDTGATVECYRLGSQDTGKVTLYNGAPQTVTCTITGGSPGSRIYTDTMEVNAKYRYGQFIEQPIVIQSLPEDYS